MPKFKKLNKKTAITFQLVYRSQQDPLAADDAAPQRVLVPVVGPKIDKESCLEDRREYGNYDDDDDDEGCDYLKDRADKRVEWPDHVEEDLIERTKAKLPPQVFPSEREEEVGLLAKAAPVYGPQLHLDPDLVAAMDEDFDYSDPENELEDNFVELALGPVSDEIDMNSNLAGDEEEEETDEFGSEVGSFEKEETKSRFTNYSMTSSVMRRNNQLTLLDERFEKMYEGYEETEIGPLDCEEIEGHVPENSDLLVQYAEEFEKTQKRTQIDSHHHIADDIKRQLEDTSDNEADDMVYLPVPEKPRWDCESVLSTYSNLYNHPKVIAEPGKIEIGRRSGMPKNVLGANKLTAAALDRLNAHNSTQLHERGPKSAGGQSIISQLSALSVRPKNESPVERRERKKKLKEYRKERRSEKKLNTEAFKEEAKRQVKVMINNRNNLQGNKIL